MLIVGKGAIILVHVDIAQIFIYFSLFHSSYFIIIAQIFIYCFFLIALIVVIFIP